MAQYSDVGPASANPEPQIGPMLEVRISDVQARSISQSWTSYVGFTRRAEVLRARMKACWWRKVAIVDSEGNPHSAWRWLRRTSRFAISISTDAMHKPLLDVV